VDKLFGAANFRSARNVEGKLPPSAGTELERTQQQEGATLSTITNRERIRLDTDGLAFRRPVGVESAAPASEPAAELNGTQSPRPEAREKHMQHGSHRQGPILSSVLGDEAGDPEAWDVRMEAHLGAFILRHLAADPPPPGACLADDVRRWAENLQHDAQARQEALGRVVRLQAV
jgi:hypothetical protein